MKSPLKIREITEANVIKEQEFSEFFHPIFTWGDAASDPIMAATDLDGKGRIYVWTVPEDHKSSASVSCNALHLGPNLYRNLLGFFPCQAFVNKNINGDSSQAQPLQGGAQIK